MIFVSFFLLHCLEQSILISFMQIPKKRLPNRQKTNHFPFFGILLSGSLFSIFKSGSAISADSQNVIRTKKNVDANFFHIVTTWDQGTLLYGDWATNCMHIVFMLRRLRSLQLVKPIIFNSCRITASNSFCGLRMI
eukprot:TRINITY_DN7313_c0_g1_i2.p1 TRINITY_DN7313_c0_g1~~TRINITY_DN7313_c0_g1_i2.p1  ORF type:complete len:136 (-),score=0.60 TRINITY_DN7313_c0_g1_i2:332-739(-)